MNAKVTALKKNSFANATDSWGEGIDALFSQSEDPEFMVNLDDIEIVEQVREQMEDDEQDLAGLGESLANYQIQAIFLRIMPSGHPKPYRLVAGERRYRAAKLKQLPQLRAKARELTDEEAEDLQFAENIHRKNLTQIEEAKKIQRDLDKLGSIDAVLEKHKKSRAWFSKMMALLNLPKQAKRLVTENVSADVEVINMVKIIEKASPEKAKALVDDLKTMRGKTNARDKALAVKEQVKPSKKLKSDNDLPDTDLPYLERTLNKIYTDIFEQGSNPKSVLDAMNKNEKEMVEDLLHSSYDAGKQTKNIGRSVIQGFRIGKFSSNGEGAFRLIAFLHGADNETKFNLLNVFGSVKS